MLNFLAFRLFFVQLGLEFTSHAVVAVLSVLQVEADLVHVGESVEILVVTHHLVLLIGLLCLDSFAQDDLLLKLFVLAAKCIVFYAFFANCLNELLLHLILVLQVSSVIHLHIFLFF